MARGCGGGLVQVGLGFALGVAAFQFLPELPPGPLPGLVFLAALALSGLWCRARPILAAAAGFLWAYLHACWVLCEPLPAQYEGRDIRVSGQIAGLPEVSEKATRFLLRVSEAQSGVQIVPFSSLVRLSWYGGETPPLRVGETWDLTVRLRRPHGFANPGGFDAERWLFQQGVRAVGSVRTSADNRPLDAGVGGYWLGRLRQHLSERLAAVLGDRPELGLVQALVLGERSGISSATWDSLMRTGTNHLVAISGLHVGIVAGMFFFLTRLLWSRSEGLCRRIAAPRAAALAGFAGALSYSALAGFAVSTQRALVMLSVVLGAVWVARQVRPITGLVLALFLVLLIDPLAVLSYGFWLSFGAVTALLYGMQRRDTQASLWWRWGRAQWVVALGLLPLLLIFFGRTSTVAPLVNLVAVPLFSLAILPGLLLATLIGLMPGSAWVLQQAASLLGWLVGGLDWLAAQPWSVAGLSFRPGWVWALGFAAVALLLAPRGVPGRWVGALGLLPVVLFESPRPGQGEFWVTLLDVGQGLSVVLRTENHLMIYDLGPELSPGFDTGSAVVGPFLEHRDWRRVDLLVLSHADKDHAGGMPGLRRGFAIDRILTGEPDQLPGVAAEPCQGGQHWEWDGVGFRVLSPEGDALNQGNDSSCVIRVANGAGSLLLTGDIGRAVEHRLVREWPGELASTLLVAAHHGSEGSSSQGFLRAVRPEIVLFSAGYANRFGFPKERVVRRVEAVSARALNTADWGAIGFRFSPTSGLSAAELYRERERRYWRPTGRSFGH
jgi:competence protein ComEC